MAHRELANPTQKQSAHLSLIDGYRWRCEQVILKDYTLAARAHGHRKASAHMLLSIMMHTLTDLRQRHTLRFKSEVSIGGFAGGVFAVRVP
jgi:hypothetical protein